MIVHINGEKYLGVGYIQFSYYDEVCFDANAGFIVHLSDISLTDEETVLHIYVKNITDVEIEYPL